MATVFPLPGERRRIEGELVEVARHARRQPLILGSPDLPTAWDNAHEWIDELLTDWQHAR